MSIIVAKNYAEMSHRAATIVASQLYSKPNAVLGLATGDTPLGLYAELVRMHRESGLSFSQAKSFNLDEYVGLPAESPHSYHSYMWRNLFSMIDIAQDNIHIPDGMAEDLNSQCHQYEGLITRAGGIDLQVLGIGKNGHIGFNEPDVRFEAVTHKVTLDKDTRSANARFFPTINEVPKYAISMGIKTIMFAKKIILLASGQEKAEVVYRAFKGPITPDLPASILQLHQRVVVIIDSEAGAHLKG